MERVANFFGYVRPSDQTAEGSPLVSRELGYRYRERLYDNQIYRTAARGGCLESILEFDLNCTRHCSPSEVALFLGYQNPVKQICDAYAGLFPGTWGDGMAVAAKVGTRDVNPVLLADDPIGLLWRWSRMDIHKQELLSVGPNLGTVGLRVYGRDDADKKNRRVYVQIDHPGRIHDVKTDERGNVTDVILKYRIPDPNRVLGDPKADDVEVEELLSATRFSKKIGGKEQLAPDDQVNDMGVCPYVLLRHKVRTGHPYGDWAYQGSEQTIHGINFLYWVIADTTRANMRPNYFATGGGDAPQTFDVEGVTVKYVKTHPDTPAPSFDAIVAAVKYEGVLSVLERLDKKLRERQPELYFNNIELFANLSGEALERAEQPTRKRLEDIRPNYDDAMRRALQIGMSYMIGMELLDLGTGTGTAEAANRAYQEGFMDFEFAPRPVLPLTTAQKIAQTTLEQAPVQSKLDTAGKAAKLPVSDEERLRLAGYSDKQIQQIIKEKSTQIPTTPL
jgi:hypothetical protein